MKPNDDCYTRVKTREPLNQLIDNLYYHDFFAIHSCLFLAIRPQVAMISWLYKIGERSNVKVSFVAVINICVNCLSFL